MVDVAPRPACLPTRTWCSSTWWWDSFWPSSAAFRRGSGPTRPPRAASSAAWCRGFEIHRAPVLSRRRPSTAMKKVLVVGEINVDLVLQGYHEFPAPGKEVLVDDFSMVLGSASAICAMGLARLGDPGGLPGQGGRRPLGPLLPRRLRGRGIDVSRVVVDPALKTGVTVAITSPARPRPRLLPGLDRRPAGATTSRTPAFDGFDHLHVSSYFLQERLRPAIRGLFAEARRLGLTTSLDPGFDPSADLGPRSPRHASGGRRLLPERGGASRPVGDATTPEEGVRRLAERPHAHRGQARQRWGR